MKTLVWVLIIFTNQGVADLGQWGVFRSQAVCEQVVENLKEQELDIEAENPGLDILDITCLPGELEQ